jgi:hypothetical protein
VAGVYLPRDISYPRCYPIDPSANHYGDSTNPRVARRWRGDQNLIQSVTVPRDCSLVSLTDQVWAGFSPDFTWQQGHCYVAKL